MTGLFIVGREEECRLCCAFARGIHTNVGVTICIVELFIHGKIIALGCLYKREKIAFFVRLFFILL